MDLKDQAINGVLWNSVGKFSAMGIEFVVGIILARLLTPKEFGLIGTIMVVIALSEIFINSGFSQALVRKQDCTQKDFSTAFFFNMAVGILFFVILLLTSGPISKFFNNHELKPLIQVLGIGLIISSLTLIQRVRLAKEINFKLQTKISIIASFLSGAIAISMAFSGFGVWSLIAKTLSNQGLNSIMLWYWNRWKPDFIFSIESFKILFGFGSKLLISGLFGTLLANINYIIIGKYFTPQDLGYFTRAELFRNLPSQNVSSIVSEVGYPVLAKVQDNRPLMKEVFRKMLVNTFFIIAILMAGMASTAEAMIMTLLGEQWMPSVVLLQMLCIIGIMVPLNTMNVNILNVVGRSDLYLKLQFFTQLMVIPNIFIGVFFGIKALIVGMIFITFAGYVIFNHESNKILNYSIREQLHDVLPSLLLAVSMALVVFFVGYFTFFSPIITLNIQILVGMVFVIISGEILGLKEYKFFKVTFSKKIRFKN